METKGQSLFQVFCNPNPRLESFNPLPRVKRFKFNENAVQLKSPRTIAGSRLDLTISLTFSNKILLFSNPS